MARPNLKEMRRKKGSSPEPGASMPSAEAVVSRSEKRGDIHEMTLRMPKPMSKALKMKAIDEDTNVTAIILRAIQKELGQGF